ncbi:MAG: hypothetical protein H0U76_20080 [Ktedonobacteraceae bacterium]|nr:hypothetical protein [Ktedonobacteraceae bacterium]
MGSPSAAPTRTIPPADYQAPAPGMKKMMNLFQLYGMHPVDEPDVLRQDQ